MGDLVLEEIVDYVVEDVDIIFQLKQIFVLQIEKDYLCELFWNIEMLLVCVFVEMEWEGIVIDVLYLKVYLEQL